MRPTCPASLPFLLAAALLAGCATDAPQTRLPARPDDSRAQIAALMPVSVPDRAGWAVDIYAALAALRVEPSADHICAVLAVIEQESTYRADPTVPRPGHEFSLDFECARCADGVHGHGAGGAGAGGAGLLVAAPRAG